MYVLFTFHTCSVKDSSNKPRAVLDAYSGFAYNIMFVFGELGGRGLPQAGFWVSSFSVVCSGPRLLYQSRHDDDAITTI